MRCAASRICIFSVIRRRAVLSLLRQCRSGGRVAMPGAGRPHGVGGAGIPPAWKNPVAALGFAMLFAGAAVLRRVPGIFDYPVARALGWADSGNLAGHL